MAGRDQSNASESQEWVGKKEERLVRLVIVMSVTGCLLVVSKHNVAIAFLLMPPLYSEKQRFLFQV
jgi:hypothetical protein